MHSANRTAFLIVSSVLAVSVPTLAGAAQVQTIIQSIPAWNAGDGHLAPHTRSISQNVQKNVPNDSTKEQVALNTKSNLR